MSAFRLAGIGRVAQALPALIADRPLEQPDDAPPAWAMDPRTSAAEMQACPGDANLLAVRSVAPFDQDRISRGVDFGDARPAEQRHEGNPMICKQAATIEVKHVDVVVIGSHALDRHFGP